MFLLVPAHPGFPGQIPQSRKTVVCVCVYILYILKHYILYIIYYLHCGCGNSGWCPTKSEAQKSKFGENRVQIDGRCLFAFYL